MIAKADLVLTASAAVADQFIGTPVYRKCRVAYSATDTPIGIVEQPVLIGDHINIVCVGRLNRGKGQAHLIAAVQLLREAGHDARLRLVGDVYGAQHHFRRALETQVEAEGLGSFVSLEGFRSDVLNVIAQADVVVVPSIEPEAFGLVVVEAMALGRPVVATAHGGPTELIDHMVNGILVTPKSAASLAWGIEYLAANRDEARRMGERGRTRATTFTSARLVDSVTSAYVEVLTTSTSQSGYGLAETPAT